MTEGGSANRWDASAYDSDHDYVSEYGADVVALLDPQPGERILDVGCGTGHLTADVADAVGPTGGVVGIDAAESMVERARENYPDCRFARADAREFDPDEPFDAVFSNAALHWIPESDQPAVAERLADALVRGGRLVAELGGAGNVAAVREAVRAELTDRGHAAENPWYFPTVGEYATTLEAAGFEVRFARLFDRPTDLDGESGLRDWLAMFGDSVFAGLDDDEREAVVTAVEDRLRDELYDPETATWTADYRRLRVVAVAE